MYFSLLIFGFAILCNVVISKENAWLKTHYDPYSGPDGRDINNDIKFYLYTRKNMNDGHVLNPDEESTLTESHFNPKHKTVIIIHGFRGYLKIESSQLPKKAFLQIDHYNVIVVDWGKLAAAPNYYKATKRVVITGEHVAYMIRALEDTFSISRSEIHLIGFSLGGHVCGIAAKHLYANDPNNGKIGRITGLDAAGPGFEHCYDFDKNDVIFADIIHTNTMALGITKPIGHADFYINYGRKQPGCSSATIPARCNHARSWQIFTESIYTPYRFPAFRCPDKPGKEIMKKLMAGELDEPQAHCEPFQHDYMGFLASPKSEGIFVVFTKEKSPYGHRWGTSLPHGVPDYDMEYTPIDDEFDETVTSDDPENLVDNNMIIDTTNTNYMSSDYTGDDSDEDYEDY